MIQISKVKTISKTELKVLKYLSKRPEGATIEEISRGIRCSTKYLYFILRYLSMCKWVRVEFVKNGDVGRPKHVYFLNKDLNEILNEAGCNSTYSLNNRFLDLIDCEYPYCIIRLKREAKILKYREGLIVKLNDDTLIEDVIKTAHEKGLKLINITRNDECIELYFKKYF